LCRSKGFSIGGKVQEDAVVSRIKAGRDSSSEIAVAAGSTNSAFSLPTNTGVRKTTFAIVHNKQLFYANYFIWLNLKLHCLDFEVPTECFSDK